MTRRPVLFRADASHALGFGHVARLAALVEELRRCGDEPCIWFGADAAARRWLAARALPTVAVAPAPATVVAEARARGAIVVVDGLALARSLVPALVAERVSVAVIDDRGEAPWQVDVVVNPNLHAPGLAARYAAARTALLGRRYAMLRAEIREIGRGGTRARHPRTRLRVAVTFGASDPIGATARVVGGLSRDRPLQLDVIAGPGFRDERALERAVAQARARGHAVTIHRSPPDLAAIFAGADAAISAAGGTLAELAYLGCPAFALAIADDQVEPARAQAAAGLVAGGLDARTLEASALEESLARFVADDVQREVYRERALATIDAEGPRRILAALA